MSRPKGPDGPLPRYQNSFAFRHNPKSKVTSKIAAIPATSLCCRRCVDIIEWKKKYRKYKPLTKPGKCTSCLTQGSVKLAYHMLCQTCAKKNGLCSKCGKARNREEEEEEEQHLNDLEEQIDELANTKGQIPGIPERERRSLLRKLLKEKTVLVKGEKNNNDNNDNDDDDDEEEEEEEDGEDNDGDADAADDEEPDEDNDDDDNDDEEEDDDEDDDDEDDDDDEEQNVRPKQSHHSTGSNPSSNIKPSNKSTTTRSSTAAENSIVDDNYTRALGDTNIFAQAIKEAKRKEDILNSTSKNKSIQPSTSQASTTTTTQ